MTSAGALERLLDRRPRGVGRVELGDVRRVAGGPRPPRRAPRSDSRPWRRRPARRRSRPWGRPAAEPPPRARPLPRARGARGGSSAGDDRRSRESSHDRGHSSVTAGRAYASARHTTIPRRRYRATAVRSLWCRYRRAVVPRRHRVRPMHRSGSRRRLAARTIASMPNRLAGETSPYLLQHANNPVDWFPWGPDALARAKLLDRPIFLSIGYAACHWCHVMERESFEHEATAALPQRPLRRGQGGPRGAARSRPAVHGRGPGDDR